MPVKKGIYTILYRNDEKFVTAIKNSYLYKNKKKFSERESTDYLSYVQGTVIVLDIVVRDNGIYELFILHIDKKDVDTLRLVSESIHVTQDDFLEELDNASTYYKNVKED